MSIPGSGALILLAFASLVVILLLVLLQLTRLGFLVRSTIPDRPRRRMFIASVSFLITFAGVRLLVGLIVHNHGPFDWVIVRGASHPSPGVGNPDPSAGGLWVAAGPGAEPLAPLDLFQQADGVSYGAGAALTLDEFALWLNLDPNDYWSRDGRMNIDAVILFGGILAVGAWGAPFFRGLQMMWSKRPVFPQGTRPAGAGYSAREVASSA